MSNQQDMFENPVQRARELKSKRRYDEARQILERELAKNPANLMAKASLADLHFRTERYKEALTLAGEVLRDDPHDPRALLVTGNALLARKKRKEGLENLRLALEAADSDFLRERIQAAIDKAEGK